MREQQARAHARQKLLPVWLGGSGTKVDGMHESRWHARKQMACAFSEASGQMPNFGLSLSLNILFVPYISTRLDNAPTLLRRKSRTKSDMHAFATHASSSTKGHAHRNQVRPSSATFSYNHCMHCPNPTAPRLILPALKRGGAVGPMGPRMAQAAQSSEPRAHICEATRCDGA